MSTNAHSSDREVVPPGVTTRSAASAAAAAGLSRSSSNASLSSMPALIPATAAGHAYMVMLPRAQPLPVHQGLGLRLEVPRVSNPP